MARTINICAGDIREGDVWLSPSGRAWRLVDISRQKRDGRIVIDASGYQIDGPGRLAADFRPDEEIEVER